MRLWRSHGKNRLSTKVKVYSFDDGNFVVLGPETFTDKKKTVIMHQGVAYYDDDVTKRGQTHNAELRNTLKVYQDRAECAEAWLAYLISCSSRATGPDRSELHELTVKAYRQSAKGEWPLKFYESEQKHNKSAGEDPTT